MKVTIRATRDNKKTILDLAEEQGFWLPCNCHGANACGGHQYSFACGMVPRSDVTVSLPDKWDAAALSPSTRPNINALSLEAAPDKSTLPDSLLIDLGTTTVAMVFYHSVSQTVFHSVTFPNPQRVHGADVISRIKYDVEFHNDYTLKTLICNEILRQYDAVRSSWPRLDIHTCLIGGNTTMVHLLTGLPLDGMAASPFTPYPHPRLHFSHDGVEVHILPWLSAFIGGDITAGLLSLYFDQRSDTCLLADLGTNGELALLHGGTLYTASTAAGPAFEGGGLTDGCPAVSGAISDIEWNRFRLKLRTIGNKLPIGICGSGAVSMLSHLITLGYVQPSGGLSNEFPPDGLLIAKTASSHEIRFTAGDVRQMQLATAAIGAGIDTLCRRAGISTQDISHLYLAGGLGHHISIEKACVTGLFSDIDRSRITSVGNSCLQGLADISADPGSLSARTSRLRKLCTEVILAEDPYFEQQFICHMTYGDSKPPRGKYTP